MATILGQRCTVFLDEEGVQRFKIESSIDAVEPGDLPYFGVAPYISNIFVHQIVNAEDPKADTFLRVSTVADLTTLPQGREGAIALAETIYQTSLFEVIYDDIATASQAKVLIQQRVDNLIADWHTYNEQFLAPLTIPPDYSSIPLPLTESLEDELKAAYNTAHAEYLTAKTATAEADAAYTAAIAAASDANDDATQAVADSQQCSTMLGQFNSADTAVDAYRAAVNTFLTASATFAAASAVYISYGTTPTGVQLTTFTNAKAVFDAAYATMAAAVSTEAAQAGPVLDAFHTDLTAACTTKIADVQIAAQEKASADLEAATASTEKKAAAQAEAAALAADTAAYLAAKAVCPEFERTVP